jgi:hypothetical protein
MVAFLPRVWSVRRVSSSLFLSDLLVLSLSVAFLQPFPFKEEESSTPHRTHPLTLAIFDDLLGTVVLVGTGWCL